ncbi:uncharacterized protein LOC144256832 [Urocitellus parryii]
MEKDNRAPTQDIISFFYGKSYTQHPLFHRPCYQSSAPWAGNLSFHGGMCGEDPVVKRFLAWDKNLRVSDKYLLSMIIAYFSRAGLFSWQYQRIHFLSGPLPGE